MDVVEKQNGSTDFGVIAGLAAALLVIIAGIFFIIDHTSRSQSNEYKNNRQE